MNSCCKLLVLVLLVKPISGPGQQQPAAKFESLVAVAQQAQAAKDYVSAANAYKQAVKIQPAMPELWANLGLMEQEAGDIPAAILSFQQANRLKPSLYVPNLFLGIDYQRTGKAAAAIPFLTKAEKINQTDPQTPLALGRAYFATAKFSPAAREFAHATSLDPKLGAAWFALGLARLNQVEADARRMSVEAKDSAFAGALYAESLEKQARFSEASTLYRSLLASQPQPPCIRSQLGFSLLRHRDLAGASGEFAAERSAHPECGLALFGQARLAIDSGDNEDAVKVLDELWGRDHGFVASNTAVLVDGLSSDAIAKLTAYFSQSDVVMPAELRNTLLAVFNGDEADLNDLRDQAGRGESEAHVATEPGSDRHTAEQHYAAGEFEQCARQLDSVVAAGRMDKIRLLAACSFFAGDDERAIAAATTLEAAQPHSPEALYWSIQANERLALEALAHFQELESDSARSHVLLGDIYDQLERFDDAEAEYTKALSIAPGDLGAMVGLASAYLSNNNNEKAMETARLALERKPQDPELNLIMAETLMAKYQYVESEPYLMKSLDAKPQILGHVHALIGKVYAETGRPREAIDQLKMSVASDENGSVHYLLARLYREIGDKKNASVALEQVKTIKQQRRGRGVKMVEDPDLSSLESPPDAASKP
ncbi:MAG: tetratricopeptide repeat protein [Terracidiphilus sp.]